MNKNNNNKKKKKVEWGFNELTSQERVLTISMTALSIVIFLLAILHLLCIWEPAVKIYVPLMAVLMMLQAKLCWDKARRAGYIYLGVAAFFLLCAIVIIFFG